jgi:hypothetical protein
MLPPDHKVQIMHKQIDGNLAVGHTFRFASGSAYTVQSTGAVVRAHPKGMTKKERRRARRDEA